MKHKVCIAIPVYNNPESIQDVLHSALSLEFSVILVDDGSTIRVSSIVKESTHLTIIRHETNKGKGEAILTALHEAKRQNFDFIITIDGDGQHYPKEIIHLLPLLTPNTIVIGNRKFKKDVPFSSKFGRVFSNFWIFVETGRWLNDTQSGFRGYPVTILDYDLQHSHYDFEIEVLVKHLWAKKEIKETEIEVYYPPQDERVSHFDKRTDNIRLSKIHTKLVIKNILRLFKR